MYYAGTHVKQDFKEAYDLFLPAAQGGNADAQKRLGDMYYYARHVATDLNQAYVWYEKAANQGVSDAMNLAGHFCYSGLAAASDYATAFDMFQRSSSLGNAYGTSNYGPTSLSLFLSFSTLNCLSLALMYENGFGVAQDVEKAIELYQKAASLGHPGAHNSIGDIYYFGKGNVEKDMKKAFTSYKTAADHDNKKGLYNLGTHNSRSTALPMVSYVAFSDHV